MAFSWKIFAPIRLSLPASEIVVLENSWYLQVFAYVNMLSNAQNAKKKTMTDFFEKNHFYKGCHVWYVHWRSNNLQVRGMHLI